MTPEPVPTLDPAHGGLTIATPTLATDPAEGHYGRVSFSVFNLRLTEHQFAELRFLRDRTGITVQAHIRRAILDYLHQLRLERPELWR